MRTEKDLRDMQDAALRVAVSCRARGSEMEEAGLRALTVSHFLGWACGDEPTSGVKVLLKILEQEVVLKKRDCPYRCKYCGRVRSKDADGHFCKTVNCQWRNGYEGCTHRKPKK